MGTLAWIAASACHTSIWPTCARSRLGDHHSSQHHDDENDDDGGGGGSGDDDDDDDDKHSPSMDGLWRAREYYERALGICKIEQRAERVSGPATISAQETSWGTCN